MQSAARVSPGQRDRILKLRNAHLQKIEGIVRKRKDIVWELQQATVMPESASGRQASFSKVTPCAHFSLTLSSVNFALDCHCLLTFPFKKPCYKYAAGFAVESCSNAGTLIVMIDD